MGQWAGRGLGCSHLSLCAGRISGVGVGVGMGPRGSQGMLSMATGTSPAPTVGLLTSSALGK